MTPVIALIAHPIVHRPFAYSLGWFSFTGFGLAVLGAFAIAQIITERELTRRGHDAAPVGDLLTACVIGTLVGAKVYYSILTGESLFSRAGFVFWGGFIGSVIAASLVVWRKHLSWMRIADVAGIAIAGGYAVGRTGCWAVGDDYGRPFSGFLATAFPEGAPPSTAEVMQRMFHVSVPAGTPPTAVLSVYPTQLYEVAMGLVIFGVLWRLRDHDHAEGWLFGVWCMLAGVERFIVEIFRAKDDRFFGAFTTAQMIAALVFLAGAAIVAWRNRVRAGAPGIYAGAPTAA